MRIDFTVDSFSNYDHLGASEPAKAERLRTYSRSGAVAAEKSAGPAPDKLVLSGNAPTAAPVDESEERVLEAAEQEMLSRLFPPGLFGNGVRAYRLAQGELGPSLGQHIDTRT